MGRWWYLSVLHHPHYSLVSLNALTIEAYERNPPGVVPTQITFRILSCGPATRHRLKVECRGFYLDVNNCCYYYSHKLKGKETKKKAQPDPTMAI